MKPADVTDEMVERVEAMSDAMVEMMTTNAGEDHNYVRWEYDTPREIIAASVNAVLGDPTPITAELLVKNGYVAGLHDPETYCKPIGDRTVSVCNHGHVYLDFGILANTKTIGQLRALEIGLGITPCQ